MDLFSSISSSLAQLGIQVEVDPDLYCYGEQRGMLIVIKESGDVETLAHEAVHILQVLNRRHGLGQVLLGLNPEEFNPSLDQAGVAWVLEAVKTLGGYPRDEWELEIPAYSLESAPERVLKILLQVIEEEKARDTMCLCCLSTIPGGKDFCPVCGYGRL